jgi:hypothetical protein
VPGLVVGAYTGNRLGAIRDAKGKSVAAVFSELGAPQKVEVRAEYVFSGPELALSFNLTYRSYVLLTDLARARLEGTGYFVVVYLSSCFLIQFVGWAFLFSAIRV